MNRSISWNRLPISKQLTCPYKCQNSSRNFFDDDYRRPNVALTSSLLHFASLLQDGERIDDPNSTPNMNHINYLTRVLSGSTTIADFESYNSSYDTPARKTRQILNAQQFINDSNLPDLSLLDQFVVYHHVPPNKFVLFLIVPTSSDSRRDTLVNVDAYFIGGASLEDINVVTSQINYHLNLTFLNLTIQWNKRLEVPPSFAIDHGFLAIYMIQVLHRNENYLDVSADLMLNFKLSMCTILIELHDQWLGKLSLPLLTKSSHPFIETEYTGKDDVQVLEEVGWHVIDVAGDGNCGFYSLILGMENTGSQRFSVDTRQAKPKPMEKNKRWQAAVYELRQRMYEHSQWILTTRFPVGKRDYTADIWALSYAFNDALVDGGMDENGDEYSGLSAMFIKEGLPVEGYFNNEFATKEMSEHHMNPAWGAYVFASLTRTRVCVITHFIPDNTYYIVNCEWTGDTDEESDAFIKLTWITNISDATELRNHRLSDAEFRLRPTIEIFYMQNYNPVTRKAKAPDHFQFLRRVICDKIPIPTISTKTLRQAIRETTGGPTNRAGNKQRSQQGRDTLSNLAQKGESNVPKATKKKQQKTRVQTDAISDAKPKPESKSSTESQTSIESTSKRPESTNAPKRTNVHSVEVAPMNPSSRKDVESSVARSLQLQHRTDPHPTIIPTHTNDGGQARQTVNDHTTTNESLPNFVSQTQRITITHQIQNQVTQNTTMSSKKGSIETVVNQTQTDSNSAGLLTNPDEPTTPGPEMVLPPTVVTQTQTRIIQGVVNQSQLDPHSTFQSKNTTQATAQHATNVPTQNLVTQTQTNCNVVQLPTNDSQIGAQQPRTGKIFTGKRHLPQKRAVSGYTKRRKKHGKAADTKRMNELFERGDIPSMRVKYVSTEDKFYSCLWDYNKGENGAWSKSVEVHHPSSVHEFLIEVAERRPDEWVGPPLGDAGDGEAPDDLITSINTIYQQHNNPYCLTYSLASTLFYCGFKMEAQILAEQAPFFFQLDFDEAIMSLRNLMKNLVPIIGLPTLYGIRTKRHSRVKRTLTWEKLFSDLTPFPTIVIPMLPCGRTTHAFCVVDDLIFDSITPQALQLKKESIDWIFNGAPVELHLALRFNTKFSPPGSKIRGKYKRPIITHWEHPTSSNAVLLFEDIVHQEVILGGNHAR